MQSFIGLASVVPEIIRGSLKTPLGPLNGKKMPGLNRVKLRVLTCLNPSSIEGDMAFEQKF